eukprot:5021341-Amphidinium_carterae.2
MRFWVYFAIPCSLGLFKSTALHACMIKCCTRTAPTIVEMLRISLKHFALGFISVLLGNGVVLFWYDFDYLGRYVTKAFHNHAGKLFVTFPLMFTTDRLLSIYDDISN